MANRVVEKQVLYEGKKVRLEIHLLEDDEGKRSRREVCVHNGAVVILGFVAEERILLLRNHRHAAGQILVELPAGTLEKKEDPMNCAGRELQEETGYLAGRLKSLGSFFSSPGILSEKMYAYAAYDLQRVGQSLEEDEELEVFEAGFDEAIEMIKRGQIQDGKTIATLLMYDKFFRNGHG
ncbi:MAG TPA: NUDIX hydrolase [Tepidisphaeraceae bacterium]|jgi:ADP-ribose pyrophosphatase|nr:NUDIX hydrolase [Tepidisphaeraceae bacterium]